MMADGVYKTGKTKQERLNRINRLGQYPGDITVILVRKCPIENVDEIERLILSYFVKEFTKHQRGNEYFTGNENDMIKVINAIIDGNFELRESESIPILKISTKSPLQIQSVAKARAKKAEMDEKRQKEKESKKLASLLLQVHATFAKVFPDKEIIIK